MQTVLIVLHLMFVTALVIVVLLQRSEGGALGMGGGGGGGFLTGRGTANVLTRTTSILAVCFFSTSLALAILAGRGTGSGPSLIQQYAPPASDTPAEGGGGNVLEQLRQQGRGTGETPAQPQTPTAPSPDAPAPDATAPQPSAPPAPAPDAAAPQPSPAPAPAPEAQPQPPAEPQVPQSQ